MMMMFNNFFGAGGVIVDADGVLRTQMTPDPNGQLSRQRIAAARSALDPKLAKKSPLRKISSIVSKQQSKAAPTWA